MYHQREWIMKVNCHLCLSVYLAIYTNLFDLSVEYIFTWVFYITDPLMVN